MAQEKPGKWNRLPKVNFDHKLVLKKVRHAEGATIKHAHKFVIKRWGNIREVQRHIIVWSLIMGALIAATGLQLMWYQQSYRTSTSAVDGTYAEAVLGPVDTLNPLFAVTSAEQSASNLIFSRMVRYDDSGKINYDLATNIAVSESDTKYTVDIRSDVNWTDGRPLTTKDILFTIDLMRNPSVRSVIAGWEDITVTVLNDYRIEFKLKSTYASFVHALNFAILPEHLLKDAVPGSIRESAFSQSPIGSGPFKYKFTQEIDEKSARKVVYLERNEDYYCGKIKLSRFQLHVYETAEQIVRALNTNEVNAAADLSPVELKSINKRKYSIISSPVQSGLYAILNVKSNLLNDKNIRKALQIATDTNAIRSSLLVDTKPLDLPFTSGQLTGEIPKAPAFDIDGAKRLLESNGWVLNKAGVREKAGAELKLSAVTLKNSESENTLEIIAKQWDDIGVKLETNVIDLSDVSQNAAQNILQPRIFDVLVYELNIGSDPDVYAYWHSSQTSLKGLNFSNYSSVISDDALTSARSRLDMQLRNAKYLTFARQWVEDAPAIGLYQVSSIYVINKDTYALKEGSKLVSSIDRYYNVSDWSVGLRSVYKTP